MGGTKCGRRRRPITAACRNASQRTKEPTHKRRCGKLQTVKRLYVVPGHNMNRPGYHTDGFLTDDINYIWSDVDPTVFNIGHFDVAPDHELSLQQFKEQALPRRDIAYRDNELLRLDQYSVHRTASITDTHLRTFFKLSFSKERYNLVGNSHNYHFDYNWPMVERKAQRNHPAA